MISCEAAERLIHRAEDGEAGEVDLALVDAHCLSCGACAAARSELVALRRLLREALPRPIAPEVRSAFGRRLAGERVRERYWQEAGSIASRWSRVAAALALALGLAAIAAVGREERAAPVPPAAGAARVDAEDLLIARAPVTGDAAAEIALAAAPR